MIKKMPRLFTGLALATALVTIGLIIFGAVVRVTDSGLGCGNSWPLCNGTIFPPLDNLTAWIEWLHRLFAALIGVLGLATLAAGWRSWRQNRLSYRSIGLAAVLFIVQSTLGALVVVLELPPTMVALHLGTALLLLAALLVGFVAGRYPPQAFTQPDATTSLTYLTTALSLVIILSGALVRGSGATLACLDWPLCYGEILPTSQGQLALIHMFHRLAVVGLGVALALLVWQVWRNRPGTAQRWLALAALLVYLSQAGVGALFVLSSAGAFWGAAHVGLAAGTWALLIILSALEYISSHHPVDQPNELQWKPQSEIAAN